METVYDKLKGYLTKLLEITDACFGPENLSRSMGRNFTLSAHLGACGKTLCRLCRCHE